MGKVLFEVAYLLEERGDVFCIVWGTVAGHVTNLSTGRGTTNSRQRVKSLEYSYRWMCAVFVQRIYGNLAAEFGGEALAVDHDKLP